MVSLNEVNEYHVQNFCFDGMISVNGHPRYLRNIPFQSLSIGSFEDIATPTVGTNVWIQSFAGKRAGVWYRVGRPAPEYRRYQTYFLWIADLAKHVVDFIFEHETTHLSDFQSRFAQWLTRCYPQSPVIDQWLKDYGDSDFRRVIASQAIFLYSQAIQVSRFGNCICHVLPPFSPKRDQFYY